MDFGLFGPEGLKFVMRWLHLFFGVIWIGLLYYFNFVQGAFFAEADAGTKSVCTQKLVPRALWWFRWGAMITFISGLVILGIVGHRGGLVMLQSSWGVAILTGAALGTLMWFNVWFVIWPSQKVVIASAVRAAGGGAALPEAAGKAARALVASRTNVLYSIPMLFFMGAASHLPIGMGENPSYLGFTLVIAVLLLFIQANALFGQLLAPLKTVRSVITSGFVFAGVIYFLMEGFL